MHTSAQHLKSLCSAVESLTEARMGSDLGRKEIPPAALGRAGGGWGKKMKVWETFYKYALQITKKALKLKRTYKLAIIKLEKETN